MIINHQHFDLNGKIVLERLVYNSPMTTNRSMQDEACLLYNIKGDLDLYSSLNKEAIGDSDCVIMKCGHYFSTTPTTKCIESSEVIAVHFYPDLLKLLFKEGLPKFIEPHNDRKSNNEISRVAVNTILNNYMEGLLLLFENPALVNDELIIHKVKEILLILLNTNSQEATNIKEILSDIFNPSQASFREIINTHCYNSITLEQLAFLCNMSLSTFKRRFLETYQQNPATYIRKKKLEKAAHLLKTTNESVASICYDIGFSDASHFTKIFTAHFNYTPTAYRKLATT